MSRPFERPAVYRRPARFGGTKPFEPVPIAELAPYESPRDRYGLPLLTWAGKYGDRVREYLALCYEFFGYDKDIPPIQQGTFGSSGSTPELVFFGGLLKRGLRYGVDFQFQSDALGGRQMPGGAVIDFIVYANGLRVGVRVDSVFHSSSFVWAGRSKVFEDEEQRIRLLARSTVDRVMEVNRRSDAYPLEGGQNSDLLVDRDFDRVLGAI